MMKKLSVSLTQDAVRSLRKTLDSKETREAVSPHTSDPRPAIELEKTLMVEEELEEHRGEKTAFGQQGAH